MDLSYSAPRLTLPTDPLRRLWGPITIRCAWDLLRAGVQVRPATLRAARDHALWRMPAGVSQAEAEAITSACVEDYLARCNGRYLPFVRDPDLDIVPVPAWRDAISSLADPIHDTVFRLHYADGLAIEEVERRTTLDVSLLRGAREALRELARVVLLDEGVILDGWEPARLDRLIARISTAAGELCPGPGGLTTEHGRAHADACPRCSRALRLRSGGILSPSDLFAPDDGGCLPSTRLDLAVIGVHPDARRFVRPLARSFGAACRMVSEDVLLVDAANVDVQALLTDAAERASPSASQLRVVRQRVPGKWTPRAVLGGGVDGLLTAVQAQAWGQTSGIASLPEPLPPPPSAARWWVGAALLAVLAAASGVVALRPPRTDVSVALEAVREPGAVLFDTDEDAWVDVLAIRAGHVEVVFHSEHPADKGRLGTGDGRYRVVAEADDLVVIASPGPIEGVDRVVQGMPKGADAYTTTLVNRLRDRYAGAAVTAIR